jgi:hypothetical protein
MANGVPRLFQSLTHGITDQWVAAAPQSRGRNHRPTGGAWAAGGAAFRGWNQIRSSNCPWKWRNAMISKYLSSAFLTTALMIGAVSAQTTANKTNSITNVDHKEGECARIQTSRRRRSRCRGMTAR